jgi:hypothetical protein
MYGYGTLFAGSLNKFTSQVRGLHCKKLCLSLETRNIFHCYFMVCGCSVEKVFHTYSEKLVGVRHQTWKFAVIGWLLIASITSAPAYNVMYCRSLSFKGIGPPGEYYF